MTENKHNVKIKKEIGPKDNQDVMILVYKKMRFFGDVIQKTIVNVQRNKVLELLGIVEVNACVERIENQCRDGEIEQETGQHGQEDKARLAGDGKAPSHGHLRLIFRHCAHR